MIGSIPDSVRCIENFLETGGELTESARAALHALTAPTQSTTEPLNDQLLIQFLELGGTLPEESRARIHALTERARSKYEQAEIDRIAWAKMDLDARLSELVEWIKESTPDTARARIHALTRKFTMSDEDLAAILREAIKKWTRMLREGPYDENFSVAEAALQDLRDQYEERGKYAPQKIKEPARCPECGFETTDADAMFSHCCQ